MCENDLPVRHDRYYQPDQLALHYAKEIFRLQKSLTESGLGHIADELTGAITLLDDLWLCRGTDAFVENRHLKQG